MEMILESWKCLLVRVSEHGSLESPTVESCRGLVGFWKKEKKSELKTDFCLKEQDLGEYKKNGSDIKMTLCEGDYLILACPNGLKRVLEASGFQRA